MVGFAVRLTYPVLLIPVPAKVRSGYKFLVFIGNQRHFKENDIRACGTGENGSFFFLLVLDKELCVSMPVSILVLLRGVEEIPCRTEQRIFPKYSPQHVQDLRGRYGFH